MKKLLVALLLCLSFSCYADEIDEMKTDLTFAKQRAIFYKQLNENEPSDYHALLANTMLEVYGLLKKVYEANITKNTLPLKTVEKDFENSKKEHIKAIAKACNVKKLCVDTFGDGSIEEAEREMEVIGSKVYRLATILQSKK